MVARDSHGGGHGVLQEAKGHSSYSATDNTVATSAAAAAADNDDDINDA
jgi:hypothetical protein